MDNADGLLSKSTISFNRAQEQTMTMVPLNDLYLARFRLLEEKARSSTSGIGQAMNEPVGQAPLFDPQTDPKKLKRIIANRELAKKSRNKQNHHVFDIEKKVNELEVDNWVKRHQIMSYQQQNTCLKEEHQILIEKSVALKIEKVAKKIEGEELRKERGRLEQLRIMQQLNGETSSDYLQVDDPTFPNTYGPQF